MQNCTQVKPGWCIMVSMVYLCINVNPNYGKGRLDRPITGSRIVQADLVGLIEIQLIWRA
jgi:hypothetical protein